MSDSTPRPSDLDQWWPCACVRGGGHGRPSTQLRLHAQTVTHCEVCGFMPSGARIREVPPAVQKTRAQLIQEARDLRESIEQIFIDATHWSATHPDEEPINPDLDGSLRAWATAIDEMLAADPGHGPLAPIRVRPQTTEDAKCP